MATFLANKDFVWVTMSIIVLGLSQILKLPIKALIKKCIKNEVTRARANTVLMLIPLCLGIFANWIFCTMYLQIPYNAVEGLKVGGTAITFYGILEKLIKGTQSKETTDTLALINSIVSDNKVDKTDNKAVIDFVEELNKIK